MAGTNDLWEVRVQAGSNIYRFLGFLHLGGFVILNHAFQKKTQKTPKKEIDIAEVLKKEFLSRGK